MRNILIIKFGALGDVIRTSYFARELKLQNNEIKVFWITSVAAVPLLVGNFYIDVLVSSFDDLKEFKFDHIYSLDDEYEIVAAIEKLQFRELTGAYLVSNQLRYTDNVSEWFDMGLLSKHGKANADTLKKRNIKTHGEIFKQIFGVPSLAPIFLYPKEFKPSHNLKFLSNNEFLIGINPYAGGRWPSKELPVHQLLNLVQGLLEIDFPKNLKIILFGLGEDRDQNLLIQSKFANKNLLVADTSSSLLDFAYQIKQLNYLITTDSLALHLSLAQGILSTAFFAPTSAIEIDSFGLCDKVISLSDDYCNYSKKCDNSTITAQRLIQSFLKNIRSQ